MTQIISPLINIPVEDHGLLEFAFFIGVGTAAGIAGVV